MVSAFLFEISSKVNYTATKQIKWSINMDIFNNKGNMDENQLTIEDETQSDIEKESQPSIEDNTVKTKKSNSKAKEFHYYQNHDVIMKYRISYQTGRGYRIKVLLINPKIVIKHVEHYNKKSELLKYAETDYADELYERIPKQALLTAKSFRGELTLQTILSVHAERLFESMKKTSLDVQEILTALCANSIFRIKSVNEITVDDCLTALGDYLEEHQLPHEDEEKLYNKCRDVLKQTFAFCLSCGFITQNPMNSVGKEKIDGSVINNRMKAGSLTEKEERELYKKYSSDSLNPINLGIALLHQTGLFAAEVCGLKYGDIFLMDRLTGHEPKDPLGDLDAGGNYVFFIKRAYRKFDGRYKLAFVMNGLESYRFIPIKRSCMKMISECYWRLRNMGFSNEELVRYPIVCANDRQKEPRLKEHCKPDTLRKYVKEYLLEVGVDTRKFYLPPKKTADYEQVLEHEPSVRVLRLNYQYKAKHVCKLSSDEIDYVLGRKPKNVDSRHYRDFRELFNQFAMKIKMERWIAAEEAIEIRPDTLVAGTSDTGTVYGWKSQSIAPSTTANRAHAVIKLKSEPGKVIDINLHCLLGMNVKVIIKSA